MPDNLKGQELIGCDATNHLQAIAQGLPTATARQAEAVAAGQKQGDGDEVTGGIAVTRLLGQLIGPLSLDIGGEFTIQFGALRHRQAIECALSRYKGNLTHLNRRIHP